MNSVRDILDAIRGLPRPDRLRLFEELATEIDEEPAHELPHGAPPPDSSLELRSGFCVYTGPVADLSALDHRVAREERTDHLGSGARSVR